MNDLLGNETPPRTTSNSFNEICDLHGILIAYHVDWKTPLHHKLNLKYLIRLRTAVIYTGFKRQPWNKREINSFETCLFIHLVSKWWRQRANLDARVSCVKRAFESKARYTNIHVPLTCLLLNVDVALCCLRKELMWSWSLTTMISKFSIWI